MYGDAPRNKCGRYRIKKIGYQKWVATLINNMLLGCSPSVETRKWMETCMYGGERGWCPQSRNCPRVLYVCINDNKVYKTERRRDTSFKALFLFAATCPQPAWPMAALARPAPLLTSLEELEASKSHLMHSNLHIVLLASLSARFDA